MAIHLSRCCVISFFTHFYILLHHATSDRIRHVLQVPKIFDAASIPIDCSKSPLPKSAVTPTAPASEGDVLGFPDFASQILGVPIVSSLHSLLITESVRQTAAARGHAAAPAPRPLNATVGYAAPGGPVDEAPVFTLEQAHKAAQDIGAAFGVEVSSYTNVSREGGGGDATCADKGSGKGEAICADKSSGESAMLRQLSGMDINTIFAFAKNESSVLASKTTSSTIDCLVRDTWQSSSNLDFKFLATDIDIMECFCRAIVFGQRAGEALGPPCSILELAQFALGCTNSKKCDPAPIWPRQIGFDKCDEALVSAQSSTKKPNEDYDLFLLPRSAFVAKGVAFPKNIPDNKQKEEGMSYYYLYRSTQILGAYASAEICNSKLKVPSLVPGWDTEVIIHAAREGDVVPTIPVATVSRRHCDFLIVIRATHGAFDWRLDFTYDQILANYTDNTAGTKLNGSYHAGTGRTALDIATTFLQYYRSASKSCKTNAEDVDRQPRVIVTGHSFGAGVATVIAHFLAVKLNGVADITTALFAPPITLDPVAAQQYNMLVNSRSFKSQFDPVVSIPCPKSIASNGLPLCGNIAVNTQPKGLPVFFVPVNGVIDISAKQLETLAKGGANQWTNDIIAEGSITITPFKWKIKALYSAQFQARAYHDCAYACYTGQFCTTSLGWKCSGDVKLNTAKCNFSGIDKHG